MNRPIFGFLWPKDPDEKDEHARQRRMIRIPARGPMRIIGLTLLTVALVILTGALIGAGAQFWPILVLGATIIATFTVLLLRAWSIGTYVNDDGVVIQRLLRADVAPWRDVQQVGLDEDCRMHVVLFTGQVYPTHISPRSADLIWRDEAFRIAVERFERWFYRE